MNVEHTPPRARTDVPPLEPAPEDPPRTRWQRGLLRVRALLRLRRD